MSTYSYSRSVLVPVVPCAPVRITSIYADGRLIWSRGE